MKLIWLLNAGFSLRLHKDALLSEEMSLFKMIYSK